MALSTCYVDWADFMNCWNFNKILCLKFFIFTLDNAIILENLVTYSKNNVAIKINNNRTK